MSNLQNPWRSGEVLAFTEREGPGRPPAAPSGWAVGALAGVLGATFIGVLATDVLCPEHRAWVQVLGGFAVFASGTALLALWRGWAGAVHLTLAASVAGVGIGLIDAVHSPTRGRLVALGFAMSTLVAAALALRALRLVGWDRQVADAGAVDGGSTIEPGVDDATAVIVTDDGGAGAEQEPEQAAVTPSKDEAPTTR